MKMDDMDPTAASFMADDYDDDFLNFSLFDDDEQTLEQDFQKTNKNPSSLLSDSLNPFVSLLPPNPECVVEEELEWLSNKDAFPAVEFGILSDNPTILFDHNSPVSVLENSSSTSHSSGGNANVSCCASLKVPVNYPVRARSRKHRRRREGGYTNFLMNLASFKKRADCTRRCQHCGTDKTPQWRAGPMGQKSLCNACGVRYKSGRLLPEYRPANSPTFSPSVHSNSHRKVMEMRRQKTGVGGMLISEAYGYNRVG